MTDRDMIVQRLQVLLSKEVLTDRWREAIEDAIVLLKNQPEIIRCKNCMHGELESWNKSQQNYKCLNSEYEGCYDYHEGDWFCADGRAVTNDSD